MKQKYIYLTAISKELSAEAQSKIDNYEEGYEEPVDSHGKTRESYENLGIPVSKEILEKEKELDKPLKITESDYHYEYTTTVIETSQFRFAIDLDEDMEQGCIIYLHGSTTITVMECALDVVQKIEYANRNWLQKLIDKITNK